MDKLCRQSSTWRAETAVLMVGDHTGTIKTGAGTALYRSWNTSTNILQRLTLKVITNIASFFTSGALQKQNLSMPNMKIVESVGEVLLHCKDESIGEVLLQGKNTGGGRGGEMMWYWPASTQLLAEVAPRARVVWPLEHSAHVLVPACGWKKPRGHCVQGLRPSKE